MSYTLALEIGGRHREGPREMGSWMEWDWSRKGRQDGSGLDSRQKQEHSVGCMGINNIKWGYIVGGASDSTLRLILQNSHDAHTRNILWQADLCTTAAQIIANVDLFQQMPS